MADETCSTCDHDFRISSNYIEASGRGEHVKIPYDQMRTLSQNNRNDFKTLVNTLLDHTKTDEVLLAEEAARLYRFSLTVADAKENFVTLKYIKGYDASGMLVVRFMITEEGAFRCQ